jgi:hypothetical protein
MAQISTHELQDIAVQSVTEFFNNSVSLNDSLCKQASDRGLNKDQLARAVEATNTLAYLRSIDVAKDRTSEFPLASYDEIVKMASLPESLLKPVEKKAALEASWTKIEEEVDLVKQANDALAYSFPELSPKEQALHLQKYAQINSKALEKAREDLEYAGLELVKQAKILKEDLLGLEHLSATSLDDAKFEKVASLVFGPGTKRKDYATTPGLFKSAELSVAQNFVNSYSEAEKLYEEVEYRKRTHEKIASFQSTLVTGAKVVDNFAGQEKTGSIVSSIVHGITRGISAPIKGAVVGTAKTLGSGAVRGGKAIADYAKTGTRNIIADTKLGKDLGIPKAQVNPASLRTKAVVGGVAGAALDASFHTPKVDPVNDMSGDVWKALNN